MLDLSYIIQDMTTKTKTERTEKRLNRFNGESVMLTPTEARIHDEIFMHELMATVEDKTLGTGASKHWQHMRKRLDWFMKNNAKAYMVLLDLLSISWRAADPRARGPEPNPKIDTFFLIDPPFCKKGSHYSRLYCMFYTFVYTENILVPWT